MDDANPAAPADAPPFGSERVARLLAAARTQFLAHGYEHLSIDGLSRVLGVSKETIYRYFPDKAALFRAAVERLDDPFARRLPRRDPGADPEHLLVRCVRAIHDATVDADGGSFIWITICMAREFPDLAATLSADGLAGMEPIRVLLEELASTSDRRQEVPLELAALLGALAIEGPRYLMGWPPAAPGLRDAAAARAVGLYLRGCLVAPGDVALPPVALEPRPPTPEPEPHLRALLQEAVLQFHARGYRGANLDEIAATARVGRGTLYRHFGSKSGLFAAAMLQAADDLAAQAPPAPVAGSLAERLGQAARSAAELLCGGESVRLHRTVIAEARRAPEVAREVYRRTRTPLAMPVSQWLRHAADQGALELDDPELAAQRFLTLATGGNRWLTSDLSLDAAERDRMAATAARLFLRGYRAALPGSRS